MLTVGALMLALAILFAFFPRLLVYPLVLILGWFAITLLYRGFKLNRRKGQTGSVEPETAETAKEERQ
jgi:cardiolipin synthase